MINILYYYVPVRAPSCDCLLAEQLRDLSLSGLDFSLEVTGFEMGEIEHGKDIVV